jgi:L-ribulose-5-phosphate 3-epimerase
MHQIGIIQGRLTPVKDGKIQSFPSDNWQNEFIAAEKIGFTLIEWILDKDSMGHNPILTSEGRAQIQALSKQTGVEVKSICCDNFMELPLSAKDKSIRVESQRVLCDLINHAGQVGIDLIELPLMGEATLEKRSNYYYMVDFFHGIKDRLQQKNMKLLLEVSIAPKEIVMLLEQIGMNEIQINYDTGNSAYWSFDTTEEMQCYGNEIGNVHIKDCTPDDYSVDLGKGNVDFDLTFGWLQKLNYQGDFILQAVRGEDDIAIAEIFFNFTKKYIGNYLNGSSAKR